MPMPTRAACIFCEGPAGGSQRTREHVLPQWMSGVLLQTAKERSVERLTDIVSGQDPIVHTKNYNAPGRSRSIKCVCARCNNGWMSLLESSCKEALTGLILGEASVLSPQVRTELARWAVKTVMVNEQRPNKIRASLSSDRKVVAEGGVPEGWLVIVCDYSGTRFQERFATYSVEITNPAGTTWSHTTTFALGRALFHVENIQNSEIRSLVNCPPGADYFIRLWPEGVGKSATWPMSSQSGESGALDFYSGHYRLLKRLGIPLASDIDWQAMLRLLAGSDRDHSALSM